MAGYEDKTWGSEPDLSADRNTYLRDNFRRQYYVVAYVEVTSDVTLPDGGAEQDIVSAGAITYKGTPVHFEFYCPRINPPGGNDGGYMLSLWDDATELGDVYEDNRGEDSGKLSPGWNGVYFKTPDITPSAGSHTYKIRGRALGAAGSDAVGLQAGGGGANLFYPIYIRVWEKGG